MPLAVDAATKETTNPEKLLVPSVTTYELLGAGTLKSGAYWT